MGTKVKITWNNKAFQQLIHSPELQQEMYSVAAHISKAAGEGFEVNTWESNMKGGRPAVSVKAKTYDAKKAEATDKVLTKAVQSCRKG